jgi:hypothetical protein
MRARQPAFADERSADPQLVGARRERLCSDSALIDASNARNAREHGISGHARVDDLLIALGVERG